MNGSRYQAAGVDIDAKYASVSAAREAIRRTFTPGVLSDIGAFGGLFDPALVGAAGQILVASTDGVGTKVKIASAMQRYDTVGHCIVNHSINDILVQGARPLFFLDYIGTGKLDPSVVAKVLEGLADACQAAGVALLGGETAEMPGMYPDGDFEIVGTIVGCVAKDRILDGSRVCEGDAIIALPSSGLHTNGYSLARKVLFDEMGLKPADRPEGLDSTVGEALLAIHRSYFDAVHPLLEKDHGVHACAHITGGGLYDNLPRVLPDGLGAVIDPAAMTRPKIFDLIVDGGGVTREEAYRVFNMGFGFLIVVDEARRDTVLAALREHGEDARACGRIVRGKGVQLA
ncbi:MAG: phosphoribosylformylglycinamidine cyclo-ligase [Planctomycetes bacterium]|nr:phosphoribosylformylglycinamidine cyclo-ligase [Planctomycetota bacterium]